MKLKLYIGAILQMGSHLYYMLLLLLAWAQASFYFSFCGS